MTLGYYKIVLNYLRFFLVYGTFTYMAFDGRAAFQNELDFQYNGFRSILKHQDNPFFSICLDIKS